MKTLSSLVAIIFMTIASVLFAQESPAVQPQTLITNAPTFTQFISGKLGVADILVMVWSLEITDYHLVASFANTNTSPVELRIDTVDKAEGKATIWHWSLAESKKGLQNGEEPWLVLAQQYREFYQKIALVNGNFAYCFRDPFECLGKMLRASSDQNGGEYIFRTGKWLKSIPVRNWVGHEPVVGQLFTLASDGDRQEEIYFAVSRDARGQVLVPLDTTEKIADAKRDLAQAKADARLTPSEKLSKSIEDVRKVTEAITPKNK
ncbi:MAG: hypothetical protein V4467_03715 [Patescibacteria group bacterium]